MNQSLKKNFDLFSDDEVKASELYREPKDRIIAVSLEAAKNAYDAGVEHGMQLPKNVLFQKLFFFALGSVLTSCVFVLFTG